MIRFVLPLLGLFLCVQDSQAFFFRRAVAINVNRGFNAVVINRNINRGFFFNRHIDVVAINRNAVFINRGFNAHINRVFVPHRSFGYGGGASFGYGYGAPVAYVPQVVTVPISAPTLPAPAAVPQDYAPPPVQSYAPSPVPNYVYQYPVVGYQPVIQYVPQYVPVVPYVPSYNFRHYCY